MAKEDSAEPESEDPTGESSPRSGIRGRVRKLFDEQGRKEAKELLGTVLDTSDRATSEVVRLIGKEARMYLEGLGLPDGVNHLLTNYSLEINASLHLKPLNQTPKDSDEEPRDSGD